MDLESLPGRKLLVRNLLVRKARSFSPVALHGERFLNGFDDSSRRFFEAILVAIFLATFRPSVLKMR